MKNTKNNEKEKIEEKKSKKSKVIEVKVEEEEVNLYVIPEKPYYEYTQDELYLLKIKSIYEELKNISKQEHFENSDIDFVKDGFIEINQILSKYKNRNYLATFQGDWYEITQFDLRRMIVKIKNEINNRCNFILIYEPKDVNNPYSEVFYEKYEEKMKKQMQEEEARKRKEARKNKKIENQIKENEQDIKEDIEEEQQFVEQEDEYLEVENEEENFE